MIRVHKNPTPPPSLQREGTNQYNQPDVLNALDDDHLNKCYLCERRMITDMQIEHLKSRHHNPELEANWENLFLACSYCNGKKLHHFDQILDPATNNIEEIIEHINNFTEKTVNFYSTSTDASKTIELLSRIYNGTTKIKNRKETEFYDYYLSRIINFLRITNQYAADRSPKFKDAIIEELNITNEFLGFKYHIIKNTPSLASDFSAYIIWNKK